MRSCTVLAGPNDITDPALTVDRLRQSSAETLARIASSAALSCSTKRQCAAPRDNASRPSAPDPANKSSTLRPSKEPKRLVSIENKVSRVRSAVGRVASPFGATSFRPRHSPAMILTIDTSSADCETYQYRACEFRVLRRVASPPVQTDHKRRGSGD